MYSKDGKTILDRREMLRVKIKSLADEAKIIRREELRTRHGRLRDELYLHRINEVRAAARASHVAYGLVRGMSLDRMEPTRKSLPSWQDVERLCKKYGPEGFTMPPKPTA